MKLSAPNPDEDRLYRACHKSVMEIVRACHVYNSTDEDPTPDFRVLRRHISSPRMQDVYLREFSHLGHVKVGLSYLDAHTMLADNREKTIAMSPYDWVKKAQRVMSIEEPTRHDSFVRVQLWTFDPAALKEDALAIAVMLSFTDRELYDPRISQAVDQIARQFGFRCDSSV
ncbi:hypothetical protein D3C85_576660 [compost metagenome]